MKSTFLITWCSLLTAVSAARPQKRQYSFFHLTLLFSEKRSRGRREQQHLGLFFDKFGQFWCDFLMPP
jgi:hypothetical protein